MCKGLIITRRKSCYRLIIILHLRHQSLIVHSRSKLVPVYSIDMASDLGQNRYSDFVALETLVRFEYCSSSHCLLSSWRRFHVFESSHPPFHRTVFFGAPLAFLRGVAMGLCRRCVIFMSSCRRVFLSSTAPHTWQVLDVWGHILYQLYLHKLYLPFL